MHRRHFLTTAIASATATSAVMGLRATPVAAAGHGAHATVATALSYPVGAAKVTAVSDGFLPIDASALSGITPEDFAAILHDNHLTGPAHPTGVNSFLVETGDRKILIDAGTGTAFGPGLGHLAANMAALGIDPASIDTIIATHLHPDHIGGLMIGDSNPFANAGLVVQSADVDFWTNDDIRAQSPEQARGFFDMAKGALARFGDKVQTVSGSADLGQGLSAVPLPGHTPGHMGVMLESDGDSLLLWGDIVHVPPVQFARPDVTIGFDTDQDQARATRQALLDQVATDRQRIAGAHIGFSGVGYVERDGDGYRFVASPFPYG